MKNMNMGSHNTHKKDAMYGIEKLEAAIAERKQALSYDDLLIYNNIGGIVRSKTKSVRDHNGSIDIVSTFRRAGIEPADRSIAFEVF